MTSMTTSMTTSTTTSPTMTDGGPRRRRLARRPHPASGSRIVAHAVAISVTLAMTAGLMAEEERDLLQDAAATAVAVPQLRPSPVPPVQRIIVERVVTRYEPVAGASGVSRRVVGGAVSMSGPVEVVDLSAGSADSGSTGGGGGGGSTSSGS